MHLLLLVCSNNKVIMRLSLDSTKTLPCGTEEYDKNNRSYFFLLQCWIVSDDLVNSHSLACVVKVHILACAV